MAYEAWTVVANEIPTAGKWNVIGNNFEELRYGTGILSNAILARHLAGDSGSLNNVSGGYVKTGYNTDIFAVVDFNTNISKTIGFSNNNIITPIRREAFRHTTSGANYFLEINKNSDFTGVTSTGTFTNTGNATITGTLTTTGQLNAGANVVATGNDLYLGGGAGASIKYETSDRLTVNKKLNMGSNEIMGLNKTIYYAMGVVSHGGTIPLPTGMLEADCQWSASINSIDSATDAISAFNVDWSGRVVSVSYTKASGGGTFNGGTASYVIIGMKNII